MRQTERKAFFRAVLRGCFCDAFKRYAGENHAEDLVLRSKGRKTQHMTRNRYDTVYVAREATSSRYTSDILIMR